MQQQLSKLTNEEVLAMLTDEEKRMSATDYRMHKVKEFIGSTAYVVDNDGEKETQKCSRAEKFEREIFPKSFEQSSKENIDGCEVGRRNLKNDMGETEKYVHSKAYFKSQLNFESANDANRYLQDMGLEEWVMVVCGLFRAMPTLIKLEDLDVINMAVSGPVLSAKGMTTIEQLEIMLQAKERKEQYLNIYVLNKMFAKLLKNDDEREVFKYLFLRPEKGSARKRFGSKLRNAYRIKSKLLSRFKGMCEEKGYGAVWFYYHFAELPPVVALIESKLGYESESAEW